MSTGKSVDYLKAEEEAKRTDDELKVVDFEWGHRVKVDHEDGTRFDFNYAFTKELSNGWFAVYTEHHEFFVFHKTEATIIEYTEQSHI